MRTRRGIAFVLLTAFLSGFGLPWLTDDHRFNDDIDGGFILTGASSDVATLAEADTSLADHCLACHWLRSIRSAARPDAAATFQFVLTLTPRLSFGPSLCTVAVRVAGDRGPPAAL